MNIDINIESHAKQEAVFSSKSKRKIVSKGRRWGFTRGCANDIIESALSGVGLMLWVDTVHPNIDRYVERYFIPVLKQIPSQYWQWRQQKKEMQILNSRIDFRSADRPENIEGFGYNKIYLNEAGIILKKRYIWENAILPMTMDYNADLIAGGTPKGGGLFKELWYKGNNPNNKDWESFHFTTYDNPYIDKSIIDKLSKDMPELVRRQEIYAEFLEDSAAVFKNIGKCTTSTLEEPMPGKRYIAGIDLAKHIDFTVITILDTTGRMVYFKRINKLNWGSQKELIIEVIKKYNNAQTLIDSTGVGDPIYDDLQRAGLDIDGYKFTSTTKTNLIESLMIAFETMSISIMNQIELISELDIFSYEINENTRNIKYNAPQGFHDDCVISLALAWWCYKYMIRSEEHTHVMIEERQPISAGF